MGFRLAYTLGDEQPHDAHKGEVNMSLGTILIILLVIYLLGGFSGRFGGYGYGFGHTGIGIGGVLLIIVVVLLLTGRI
jgi:ABC-type tungstate transport system substrate-binding protein